MAAGEGYAFFSTPIGECGIAWRGDAIVGVQLPGATQAQGRARMAGRFAHLHEATPPAWVADAMRRIAALLEGEADDLRDLPLDMSAVPEFNRCVYEISRGIAPGRTLTYGDIALQLGDKGLARAVGQALGHNPFAPVVPCHRILGAGNSGTGFSAAGGVATKLKMLEIERAQLGGEPGLFD
ncbi:methylated-DNA--[protein]-cysteine S-methyltransferase [Caenimonas koreensis]|uniref:methylated-DNA--[protein]-cysteine S-methyltransferase n=1 Tax=Caenimonas koreensis TaxID=367474 RepID=UPI0037841653